MDKNQNQGSSVDSSYDAKVTYSGAKLVVEKDMDLGPSIELGYTFQEEGG